MKKITLALLLWLQLLLLLPGWAAAAPAPPEAWEDPDQILDLAEMQQYVQRLDEDLHSALPELDFKALVTDLVRGNVSWEPGALFSQALNHLFQEVLANSALLGKLVVLAVICALLQNLTNAFERGAVGQLAHMITYLALITIAVASFGLAINMGRAAVDQMVGLMQALLPLLLTLLVAVGGIASAAIFHPIIFVAITVFGTMMKNVVLPLLFFAVVLDIVSGLSAQFQVSRLAALLRGAALGVMGLLSTVFLGLLAIQGVAGAVTDSITFRTAKFATNTFIPVVGGVFSDALEAMIRSSLLLKNAVGIAGVIMIILVLAAPLVKILAIALIYKLAGAVVQPMGEARMGDCLNNLGSSLITVFGAVAIVGLLFFFALAIVVGLGNFTVMLH